MDQSSTVSGNPPEGKLPADLAVGLKLSDQKVLDQPVRRDILRQLLARHPQSPAELTLALPTVSLSGVQYHLGVLTINDAVTTDSADGANGWGQNLYSPAFEDEGRIVEVLRKMEKQDSAAAPRPLKTSRSPLSPRRLISIRLGRKSS